MHPLQKVASANISMCIPRSSLRCGYGKGCLRDAGYEGRSRWWYLWCPGPISHPARGQPQWQRGLGHCLQASSYSISYIPEVSGMGMVKVVWRMLCKNEVADGDTFGVLVPSPAKGQPLLQNGLGHCLWKPAAISCHTSLKSRVLLFWRLSKGCWIQRR